MRIVRPAIKNWLPMLALAAVLIVMAGLCLAQTARAAPASGLVEENQFAIFQVQQGTGEKLWEVVADRDPMADLPITQRQKDEQGFNRGFTRAADGDRIGYGGAYYWVEHEDPGHHPFVRAFRVHFVDYGPGTRLINDKRMREDPFNQGHETQGLLQYPYEIGVTIPVDTTRPGGVVELVHLRGGNNSGLPARCQVLQTFTVPATDPDNLQTKWYYQLSGEWVAVHEGRPTAKLQLSATHHAYGFRVQGVPSQLGC